MPQFGVTLAQPQQRQAHQEQSRAPRRIIGVDYGPFRPGQQPGGPCPTLEEITADMSLLKRMAPVTRIYGLRDCGIGEKVLKASNKFRQMLAPGLWLSRDQDANAGALLPEGSKVRYTAENITTIEALASLMQRTMASKEDVQALRADRATKDDLKRALTCPFHLLRWNCH